MDINVRPNNLKKTPDTIESLGKALRSYSETVSAIANDPHIDDESKEIIAANLKKNSERILEAAAAAESFSTALRMIAASYESTEKDLVAAAAQNKHVTEALVMASAGSANDLWDKIKNTDFYKEFRLILAEMGVIKAEKQTRTEGEPVTKYQEREMDIYMMQEIDALKKSDHRFSEEYWSTASVAERKQILQDYINRVCDIMGLPRRTIQWDYSPSEVRDGRTYANYGAFHRDDNSIHINEWVLENGDSSGFSSYREITTVTHELRHYYQWDAVNHPDKYVVTTDTVNAWDQSFKDYKTQAGFMREGMSAQDAFEAYQNQTVEVDARHFARQD